MTIMTIYIISTFVGVLFMLTILLSIKLGNLLLLFFFFWEKVICYFFQIKWINSSNLNLKTWTLVLFRSFQKVHTFSENSPKIRKNEFQKVLFVIVIVISRSQELKMCEYTSLKELLEKENVPRPPLAEGKRNTILA